MADFDLSIYERKIHSFRASDGEREQLVSDLLTKHLALLEEYRTLKADYDSERAIRRNYQRSIEDQEKLIIDKDRLLADQMQHQMQMIENNSFVLALIDGDGVIFQDALLQAASSNGGSEAASRLQAAIRDHLVSIYGNSGNWPIMVQIYVSLDKLGQKLAQVGMLRTPYELRLFAQNFSLNQPLFSIVDVGQGKERADHKIKEMLRTFSDNPTCRHIFFGGCHDAGYLLNLDQYKHNEAKAARITLLESTPAYKGFTALPNFKRARFDEVFKAEALPDGPPPPVAQSNGQPPMPAPVRTLTNKSSPSASPKTTPATISPTSSSPTTTNASLNSKSDQTPTDPSWANVGRSGSTAGVISLEGKKSKKGQKRYIYYNKDNQRLDEPLPPRKPDAAAAVDRRRNNGGKNLCNNYHLGGHCDMGNYCEFQHGPKLSPDELNALKYKTRTLACKDRGCERFDCYLGHQCVNERDVGYCKFHDTCNLRATHGMDRTKYSRWDEEGNEEIKPAQA